MAREYKVEVHRTGPNAILYYHQDDKLELTDPDTDAPSQYLITKLRLIQEMIGWCRQYGVTSFEVTKV